MVRLFNSGILQHLSEEPGGEVKKGLYDEYTSAKLQNCSRQNQVLIEFVPLSKDSTGKDYLDYDLQPYSIEYTSRDTLVVGEYYMHRDSYTIAERCSLKECGEVLKKLAVKNFDGDYNILNQIF
jgi:hypothetical protein